MLAYTYMQAFYTDWVHCVYPICVECLHIGICKHSTQIGYIKFGILHKLGTFFHIFEVSKMCPICVECLRIDIIALCVKKVSHDLTTLKVIPNMYMKNLQNLLANFVTKSMHSHKIWEITSKLFMKVSILDASLVIRLLLVLQVSKLTKNLCMTKSDSVAMLVKGVLLLHKISKVTRNQFMKI